MAKQRPTNVFLGELAQVLKEVSATQDRNASSIARIALREYFDRNGITYPKATDHIS